MMHVDGTLWSLAKRVQGFPLETRQVGPPCSAPSLALAPTIINRPCHSIDECRTYFSICLQDRASRTVCISWQAQVVRSKVEMMDMAEVAPAVAVPRNQP